MKINITTTTYFPNVDGTSNVVQTNVKVLIDLGFEVNVYTSKGSISKYGESVYTFDISGNGRLFNKFIGEIENYTFLLKKNSDEKSINIYHGWHCWTTHLALDLNLKNVKQIVYSHGIGFNTLEPFLKKQLRKILYFGQKNKINQYLNLLDAMIFISNDVKHPRNYDYLNFRKKSFLINNPVLNREISYSKSDDFYIDYIKKLLSQSCNLFLNISNYQSVKNQKFLINLINDSIFETNIIFIGSKSNNYFKYLEKYTKNLSNRHRIHFFYQVSDYVIDFALTNSDCFLFSSKNDFVPLVLIEANKYGLPFLSFKTADIKRKGGIYVSNNEEYKKEFLKICNMNTSELKNMGTEGQVYYLKNNTLEKYREGIENFLKMLDEI